MNAFDMISEPLLFAQQLCEHLAKTHQNVELLPSLADAMLAQDDAAIRALHEQVSQATAELDPIKLSLYAQINHMHFHSISGPALNHYLICQDKVAGALQEFADLLLLRRAALPAELHADVRALVAQIVNVSWRTLSLIEGLSPDAQTLCPDTETPDALDIIRQVHDENNQARRLEMKLARHVHSLEGQLDPATLLFLDRCRDTWHEMADDAEHTADCLYLMVRRA